MIGCSCMAITLESSPVRRENSVDSHASLPRPACGLRHQERVLPLAKSYICHTGIARRHWARANGEGGAATALINQQLHLLASGRRRPCLRGVKIGDLETNRASDSAMAVHTLFATLLAKAPRREGILSKMGLSPIAEALEANEKSQPDAVAV